MLNTRKRVIIGSILLVACQTASAITINLDYSHDTNGFFTSNTYSKNLMETAASYFETHLTDSLSAITSSGSNNFSAHFTDPGTGSSASIDNYSVAADTITVYVGGRDLGSSTLGLGGPGGFGVSGSTSFYESIVYRGEAGSGYNDKPTAGVIATDFHPWGGSISFNTTSNWYFDDDVATTESFSGSDFFSVALHELGHVLGLGTADSWDNLINGSGEFTGANAVAANGGNVALADTGHWDYGTMSFVDGVAQEAAMDPNLTTGTRKLFTDLDLAALDDIGWDVATSPVPLPPALLLFASGILGIFGLGKRKKQA